jgi:arginine decarboxylase
MTEHLRAYNSLWQVRSDSWCRLEEAADRLTRPTTTGALKDKYVSACQELLARLSTLEPYWAYPGSPQFARIQRLFAAGSYDKFTQEVVRINRALTTESYRSGDVDNAGADDLDMFPSDPRQAVDLDLHKVRYWRAAERLPVAQPVLTRRTRVDQ